MPPFWEQLNRKSLLPKPTIAQKSVSFQLRLKLKLISKSELYIINQSYRLDWG